MRYIFCDKDTIERDENNGYTLLMDRKNSYRLVLNETGKEIYGLLKPEGDTEEIIKQIHEIYSYVPENEIREDVLEILNSLDVYGIITLERSDSSSGEGELFCDFSGDKTYRICSEFIKNNFDGDCNVLQFSTDNVVDSYAPVPLRLRVMQNSEYQVFAKKNDDVVGFISFSNTPEGYSRVVNIRDLVLKVGMEDSEKKQIVDSIINKALSMYKTYTEISKVRVSMLDGDNPNLLKLLLDIGFIEEALLSKEMINGDLKFITRML